MNMCCHAYVLAYICVVMHVLSCIYVVMHMCCHAYVLSCICVVMHMCVLSCICVVMHRCCHAYVFSCICVVMHIIYLLQDTSVCSVNLLNWPGHHEVYTISFHILASRLLSSLGTHGKSVIVCK